MLYTVVAEFSDDTLDSMLGTRKLGTTKGRYCTTGPYGYDI